MVVGGLAAALWLLPFLFMLKRVVFLLRVSRVCVCVFVCFAFFFAAKKCEEGPTD